MVHPCQLWVALVECKILYASENAAVGKSPSVCFRLLDEGVVPNTSDGLDALHEGSFGVECDTGEHPQFHEVPDTARVGGIRVDDVEPGFA